MSGDLVKMVKGQDRADISAPIRELTSDEIRVMARRPLPTWMRTRRHLWRPSFGKVNPQELARLHCMPLLTRNGGRFGAAHRALPTEPDPAIWLPADFAALVADVRGSRLPPLLRLGLAAGTEEPP